MMSYHHKRVNSKIFKIIYLFRRKYWKTDFLAPIKKEVIRFDKNEKEITKIISYRLKFVNDTRYMKSLLSSLANNLVGGIHKIKCKNKQDNKKFKICGIK